MRVCVCVCVCACVCVCVGAGQGVEGNVGKPFYCSYAFESRLHQCYCVCIWNEKCCLLRNTRAHAHLSTYTRTYTYGHIQAHAHMHTRTHNTVYLDVDECLINNGGCGIRPCTNTVGSSQCGACPSGTVENGSGDCIGAYWFSAT